MTSLRLAALAALTLAGFVPVTVAVAQAPVEWYTDTGGGGVLAQPSPHTKDGGAEAPRTATGPVDLPESDISAAEPVASSAQAEPVLGAPSDEPAPAADRRPQSRASQDAPTVTGGEDQDASDAGLIASLPLTGLQLAAVAGAGLCLLLAGAALRPRRRPAASR
jgi:hypothetical protein